MKKIQFTKIKHDINGNPRYVCHFLNLLKDNEQALLNRYDLAVKRANTIGGRKYNVKAYRGGIVFQSYYLDGTEQDILNLVSQ